MLTGQKTQAEAPAFCSIARSERLTCPLQDEATGETKIGLSYDRLCQTVSVGNRILIADGTIVITVEEILNDKELRGKASALVLQALEVAVYMNIIH